MKNSPGFYFCLLTFLVYSLSPTTKAEAKDGFRERELTTSYTIVKTPTDGGIREMIPSKFREKYERWKAEFLSTEFGREQWRSYAANKNFILTIKVSGEAGEGGGTGDYQWDESGNLVGATILLGSKIDKGYPNPIYFPVMNSLSITSPTEKIGENLLAAAKIAHEFGHVNQTARTNGELFRQQNKLILEYNAILESSRFNVNAPRLISLRKKLGGTPVEIWESREYWGETNAMRFVLDRLEGESYYCPVVSKIETNVRRFAANYEDRFAPVFNSSGTCRN